METGQGTILLIEDDQALAKLLTAALSASGYDVHAEYCGATALVYAAEHRPDLVILDLRLPDMDGYAVCGKLREFYGRWEMPILMLTGMDRPIDELRGFAHGADAYMVKPFDFSELRSTILLLKDGAALE